MRLFCFEDCEKGKDIVYPCLKVRGHEGQHQHKGRCTNKCCMCHWDKKEVLK